MTPHFSVLLSLYIKEKPEYLDEALSSVFEQTLPPNEVVLVLDGAITEELQAVVDRFKSQYPNVFKVVPLPENVGLGPALNEGLKHCSHELVARMDTDDVCKPHRFEKQVEVFAIHPELAVVGSWVDEFSGSTDNVISQRRLPETHEKLRVFAQRRSPLNHPSVMFRKKAVEAVGGYLPFYLFEDYYLWVRLIHNGYRLQNFQDSLLYFRYNDNMLTRRAGWKYAKTEYRLMHEFYRMGFINLSAFLTNICLRVPVRLLPVSVLRLIYRKILR